MSAEEEPSRAAGACVLVVLGGVAVAAVFAIDEAAGILLAVVSGAVALYRSARRMSDSRTTPPPEGVAPLGDVSARETGEVARVVRTPEGVMCIIHPIREEEVNDK